MSACYNELVQIQHGEVRCQFKLRYAQGGGGDGASTLRRFYKVEVLETLLNTFTDTQGL